MSETARTIGVLYPGDMGAAVARLLRQDGHRVVTTLAGRGPQTQRQSRDAGVEALDDLASVVQAADVLLILVPPSAAEPVARQVRELLARRRRSTRLLYADLNSVSPETMEKIVAVFAGSPVDVVDGAILGPAAQIGKKTSLHVSGGQATRLADLFAGKMTVHVLGNRPGQASTLKMLVSGLTKGVCALVLEMALAARRAGLLDEMLDAYRASYPGIMELVERMVPTYPRHAVRRGQEMREVEETLRHLGLTPAIAAGVRDFTVALGEHWPGTEPDRPWSAADVINDLHAREALRGRSEATHPD